MSAELKHPEFPALRLLDVEDAVWYAFLLGAATTALLAWLMLGADHARH